MKSGPAGRAHADARVQVANAMSEADVDRHVFLLAKALKVYAYHPRISVGSKKGWPDWSLIGTGGMIFRENKSASGKCTPEQRAVGYALQALGMDWDVWRPADVISGRIERELRALTARPRTSPTQPG